MLKNTREKEGEKVYIAVIRHCLRHLRLPQKIPSDSMVQERPEARWTHGTLNQAVEKNKKWLWHSFGGKKPTQLLKYLYNIYQ